MTDKVIIYTQDDCPPCTFIKNYLVNKNIKMEIRYDDVSHRPLKFEVSYEQDGRLLEKIIENR